MIQIANPASGYHIVPWFINEEKMLYRSQRLAKAHKSNWWQTEDQVSTIKLEFSAVWYIFLFFSKQKWVIFIRIFKEANLMTPQFHFSSTRFLKDLLPMCAWQTNKVSQLWVSVIREHWGKEPHRKNSGPDGRVGRQGAIQLYYRQGTYSLPRRHRECFCVNQHCPWACWSRGSTSTSALDCHK